MVGREWVGSKSDNISEWKGNGGVERPMLLPVPSALRDDPRQVWGMWGMTREGTKLPTVPQREALFWAKGVQEVSCSSVWKNGWMVDQLSGWMLVLCQTGWPALPAHRASMQGNQGKSEGMQGIMGEQSQLLSPRERSCPGLQGMRSQPLWMDRWMTKWLTCCLTDKKEDQ